MDCCSRPSESSSDDASPVEEEGLPGGRWTGGETRLLKSLVEKHGTNWAKVSEGFHGRRTGKQCRERYYNHGREGLDKERPWTMQEEWILICQHKEHGNSWTQIAECLEGRSESGTKNKWYSTKRAKLTGQPTLLQQYIQALGNTKRESAYRSVLSTARQLGLTTPGRHIGDDDPDSAESDSSAEMFMPRGTRSRPIKKPPPRRGTPEAITRPYVRRKLVLVPRAPAGAGPADAEQPAANSHPPPPPQRLARDPQRLTQDPQRLTQDPLRLTQHAQRLTQDPQRLTQHPQRPTQDARRLTQVPQRLTQHPERPQDPQDAEMPDAKQTARPAAAKRPRKGDGLGGSLPCDSGRTLSSAPRDSERSHSLLSSAAVSARGDGGSDNHRQRNSLPSRERGDLDAESVSVGTSRGRERERGGPSVGGNVQRDFPPMSVASACDALPYAPASARSATLDARYKNADARPDDRWGDARWQGPSPSAAFPCATPDPARSSYGPRWAHVSPPSLSTAFPCATPDPARSSHGPTWAHVSPPSLSAAFPCATTPNPARSSPGPTWAHVSPPGQRPVAMWHGLGLSAGTVSPCGPELHATPAGPAGRWGGDGWAGFMEPPTWPVSQAPLGQAVRMDQSPGATWHNATRALPGQAVHVDQSPGATWQIATRALPGQAVHMDHSPGATWHIATQAPPGDAAMSSGEATAAAAAGPRPVITPQQQAMRIRPAHPLNPHGAHVPAHARVETPDTEMVDARGCTSVQAQRSRAFVRRATFPGSTGDSPGNVGPEGDDGMARSSSWPAIHAVGGAESAPLGGSASARAASDSGEGVGAQALPQSPTCVKFSPGTHRISPTFGGGRQHGELRMGSWQAGSVHGWSSPPFLQGLGARPDLSSPLFQHGPQGVESKQDRSPYYGLMACPVPRYPFHVSSPPYGIIPWASPDKGTPVGFGIPPSPDVAEARSQSQLSSSRLPSSTWHDPHHHPQEMRMGHLGAHVGGHVGSDPHHQPQSSIPLLSSASQDPHRHSQEMRMGHVGAHVGGHLGGDHNSREMHMGHVGAHVGGDHDSREAHMGHVKSDQQSQEMHMGHVGGHVGSDHDSREMHMGHVGGHVRSHHDAGEMLMGHVRGHVGSHHHSGEMRMGPVPPFVGGHVTVHIQGPEGKPGGKGTGSPGAEGRGDPAPRGTAAGDLPDAPQPTRAGGGSLSVSPAGVRRLPPVVAGTPDRQISWLRGIQLSTQDSIPLDSLLDMGQPLTPPPIPDNWPELQVKDLEFTQ